MRLGVSYKDIVKGGTTNLQTGFPLIRDELELLINFKKHGLFFGNNLGLDLEKYLYLSNKEATFHLIRDDIIELLRKYGKVYLKELSMEFKQDNTIHITIVVVTRDTGELLQLPFQVSQ